MRHNDRHIARANYYIGDNQISAIKEMVKYDYLELLKAIRICSCKHGYSVFVFSKTGKQAEDIFNEAKRAIDRDETERRMLDTCLKQPGTCTITYRNRSVMKFSMLNERSRGYRVNCVIYDSDINARILRETALQMECQYMEENNGTSRRI